MTRGGDYSGMLSDPLVPLDFGGWFRRVFGVFNRSFRQLALLAAIAAVLSAITSVVMTAVTPTPIEVQQHVMETRVTDQTAVLGYVYGQMAPALLVMMVLMLVATGFIYGASFYIAIRDANGQPSSLGDALGFATPRVLKLIGWELLAGIAIGLVALIPLVPALATKSDVAGFIGGLVAAVLVSYLSVTVFSSLFGVVLIERAGVRRCFELIKKRFWATLGRLLVAVLLPIPYLIAVGLLVALLGWVLDPNSVIVAVVQAALTIPLTVFMVAVLVVTYAELRFWENTAIATRSLASELNR